MASEWKFAAGRLQYRQRPGVPEEMRKAAREMKTCLEIARADGGGWKLVTSMGDKSRTVVFPLGQEVDTISLMREPIKVSSGFRARM
nr:hypothetical protein BaRGS_025325 [Batillaria attramentaria]